MPRGHPRRLRFARRRDLEAAASRRGPGPSLLRARVPAHDFDAVRHHESRVEPHPELADQARAIFRLCKLLHESASAGAGDGAEIVDEILPPHADAVIGDGERAFVFVGRDADDKGRAVRDQSRGRDGLVAEPVASVGRVGNELAQEDVGFRVDRMHHQPKQFGDLSLE